MKKRFYVMLMAGMGVVGLSLGLWSGPAEAGWYDSNWGVS